MFCRTSKWLASQSIPRSQIEVESSLAAVMDGVALEVLLALISLRTRDDQAGDPRTGHAGG